MMTLRKLGFIAMIVICSSSLNGQNGVWTWQSGSDSPNGLGNYGIQGIPDSSNEPTTRIGAAQWEDKDGNFWIFGGRKDTFDLLNDLWKFNPYSNEWAWMNGADTLNPQAIYGDKGVPAPTNMPPGMDRCLSWYDGNDGLYLYGGISREGEETIMWKYSIENNEWVWLTGSNVFQDPENSGVKGVTTPFNNPGTRYATNVTWVHDEKLWFSLGYSESWHSSDTWHFDINTLEWTWVHGPTTYEADDIIGIIGQYDENNYPGSRLSLSRMSNQSSVYVYNGHGLFINNALWQFNSDSLAWRVNNIGPHNAWSEDYCDYNEQNIPRGSSYFQTTEVFGSCRDYLFVLQGQNPGNYSHALWAYDLSDNTWVLLWGIPESETPMTPFYGEKGIPSLENVIPVRRAAQMWSDTLGNLWVFGGYRSISGYDRDFYSDMWRFEPDYSCFSAGDSSLCCELMVDFRISHAINSDSEGSIEIQVLDGGNELEYSIDGGGSWHDNDFFDELPPGEYHIVVRDENGCFYYGTVIILDLSVGVEEIDDGSFSIYPNPSSDILHIKIHNINGPSISDVKIKVIDAQGRLCTTAVSETNNNELLTKVSLTSLSDGNYFIQITIGDEAFLRKISKI